VYDPPIKLIIYLLKDYCTKSDDKYPL